MQSVETDIAVVGLGLIGGAALRHLAPTHDVVGLGPAEPDDWATHEGPFSSHYDSGRVTRRLDGRFEWAELASRSIAGYPQLERETGLRFHYPVGMLFVRGDDAGIENQRQVIERLDLPVHIGSTGDLDSRYALPIGLTFLHEPAPAGFVDPRQMLLAQLTLAERGGAVINRTWATAIQRSGRRWKVEGADGSVVYAEQVLVATGPYLNDLLGRPLAARVMPEAVVLGRISTLQAERLADLPSMIYLPSGPYQDVYVVPPARYPDGRWYVKIGGSISGTAPLASADAKRKWMSGDAADGQSPHLQEMLRSVLPDVRFDAFFAKPCLITDTAHGLPYVDQVGDGLFVAVGGCGHAAKSSDAIGALAARLMATGDWSDTDLDRRAFAAVFGELDAIDEGRHSY